MADLIDRQAVIDAVVAWTVEDRPDIEMPTDLVGRIESLPSAQPEPKCANGCIYGWGSTECEHCALKSTQPEEVFEIGKPHPLKGYEFCIFKDVYGGDWVEIRKYQEAWRGEEHETDRR